MTSEPTPAMTDQELARWRKARDVGAPLPMGIRASIARIDADAKRIGAAKALVVAFDSCGDRPISDRYWIAVFEAMKTLRAALKEPT